MRSAPTARCVLVPRFEQRRRWRASLLCMRALLQRKAVAPARQGAFCEKSKRI